MCRVERRVRTLVVLSGGLMLGWGAGLAQAQTPKVVGTVPAANETDVDPGLDQIVVTFDMPVKMNSWSLVPVGDGTFPDLAGDEPITFRDNKTCVIKVSLRAATAYGLAFNSKTRQGFKSAKDGTPAEPYQLFFKTGGGKPPAAPQGPAVVKTAPANGARDLEAGTFDLTIVFAEPMSKGAASIMTPPEGPRLQVIGKPTWKDARTFIVPVLLASGTTYRVGINTGENKRFVSAGDGTPASPYEFVFSTAGPVGAEETPGTRVGGEAKRPDTPGASADGKPVLLRYNYQQGDAGRLMARNVFDIKLRISSGETVPIVQKSGLSCIEEVLAVEAGKPVEVRKLISEYLSLVHDPESGELKAGPRLDGSLEVKVNRRADPPRAEVVSGQMPDELAALLASDYFPDVMPSEPVKVGESFGLPRETLEYLKGEFGTTGDDTINIKLNCQRMGPMEVADARNEMYKARGGGTPIDYIFDVAEFDIDWLQDCRMPQGIPFTLAAKGKIVFAMEAGVLLKLSIDGKITIKQTQVQGDDGQPVTITGDGVYVYDYAFEPMNWTRGVRRKGDTSNVPRDGGPAAAPTGMQDRMSGPMSTPKGSIEYQFSLLKAGDFEALRACFTEQAREVLTADVMTKGRQESKDYAIDDLVAEVIEGQDQGKRTAKIKMKNGRTLTTMIWTEGKWLADTVWFK